MPNIKSAAKRAKTSEKSRLRNTKTKAELKTLRKNLLAAVEEAAAPKTDAAYRTFCAALDKGVKHGIIPKNRKPVITDQNVAATEMDMNTVPLNAARILPFRPRHES